MRVVCSFCPAVIRPGTSPGDQISHGICSACYNRILTSHGFNVRKFVDLFDAPVILVDADVRILEANSLAIAAVGKPVAQVKGTLCGDMIDCVNAFLPEGCGNTRTCPDCTLRDSVNQTYATGDPVTRRPAVVTRRAGNTEEHLHFRVTTRKDGGVVLLRLEPWDQA